MYDIQYQPLTWLGATWCGTAATPVPAFASFLSSLAFVSFLTIDFQSNADDVLQLLIASLSNLHPCHPAAPPLDAMAPATSVGGTHDTEGRADTTLTASLSLRPSVCLSVCPAPLPPTTTTSRILTLCVAQHRIENMRGNTNQWRRCCQPFQLLLLVLLHFDASRATSRSGKLSLVVPQRNSPVASVGGAASLIRFSEKWLLCFNSSLIALIKAPYNINIE